MLLGSQAATATDHDMLQTLQSGWEKPARTYKPHTRWWWPGNALTKADITWQLEQMARQGMGGVEIMSTWKMYERGNVEYLSPTFIDLVKHAVAEGKRLDLDVAITFGPGWSFGGSWLPKEDQSKVLCMGAEDLAGATHFSGRLPEATGKVAARKSRSQEAQGASNEPGRLVAVVAGRLTGTNRLDSDSLTVLTSHLKTHPSTGNPPAFSHGAALLMMRTTVRPSSVKQNAMSTLEWDVPPGQWRLMAFWLKHTGQENQAQSFNPLPMVLDHLNKGAVQRYCDYLGGTYARAFRGEFGTTVDSFFCDSFEIKSLPNSLLWSDDTLAGFERHSGYDFTKYLPALWCDLGAPTPRFRYDLGQYLSDLGLDTIFKTFNDWCDAHHLQARIQPHYRFMEELVQGAGATARPETEVTTARFDPVADPHKAEASGARFYGRDHLSAEAYTFIYPARYRTGLQDFKIATDAFLRDGVTQFYNHGYFGSPEMHVAPNRDMPWANRISHWNTWWPYYHCLADYVARCCYILRQGKLVSDVLIYSPQATAWSERAIWGNDRRVMQYGNLAKTLVANGYDFDIVNDDLLQHRATCGDGGVAINGYKYRVLILPHATVIPIESMRAIAEFVKAGGKVIALQEMPKAAAGLINAEANDRELKQIVSRIFGVNDANPAGAVFLPAYRVDGQEFNPMRQPYTTTPPLTPPQRQLLAVLGQVTPPDFALAHHAQSDGLTFIHKRMDDVDVYFVCNLEPTRIATDVTFRVTGKTPQRWDAVTGETGVAVDYRAGANGTTISLEFEPWESAFFIFTHEPAPAKPAPVALNAPMPESLPITGEWKLKLEGYGFETLQTNLSTLVSWADAERTRHFSGTGRYEIDFNMAADRLVSGTRMTLDLGHVGTIAEVELNGQKVGVTWMAPHRLDITRAIHAGTNHLVLLVTDTLINYVSGLPSLPEVPVELQSRLGKANPLIYPAGQKAPETQETDLPPSGLIGPVQIKWQVNL